MSEEKHLNCNFCGKNRNDVEKLIAGPGVYICDECVELCNDMIVEENERHRDIIQGSFLDSYGNLTLKTRMALKWTVEDCPSAKYVMKTDDDMWINVPNIIEDTFTQFRIVITRI